MIIPYRLRPMTVADLETVRSWRNLPAVRENMYTRHEITREEHEAYFARALVDRSKRYFLCEDEQGDPVGVVSFTEIDEAHGTATWAFYSGDASRRGVGSWMELLALDHAFTELGLTKLSCEVLEWNEPVIRFHLKHGFRREGIFRRHHVKDGHRYDIHRLAIFRDDWERQRPEILERLTGGRRNSGPLSVGHRQTTPVDVPPTASSGELLVLAAEALEHLAPGTDVRIDHLESTIATLRPTKQAATLVTHIVRSVDRVVTVAFEMTSADDTLLRGHANLTIAEDAP